MNGENLEKRIEEPNPADICRKVDSERASQRMYARQDYVKNHQSIDWWNVFIVLFIWWFLSMLRIFLNTTKAATGQIDRMENSDILRMYYT